MDSQLLPLSILKLFIAVLLVLPLTTSASNSNINNWNGHLAIEDSITVSGELKKWHTITVSFIGPFHKETDNDPNPFMDYRLDVVFKHTTSNKTYTVPGYFATDGNAAETSANEGNIWRVHFTPDETGEWTYTTTFLTAKNVAVDKAVDATEDNSIHGKSGTINVAAATNKTGKDFRSKGRLSYVGKHHLQFEESGEYFIKGGADAPENILAYEDFDNTPNIKNRRKTWEAHIKDWKEGDPTWKDNKGKGIIGAINYLASEEMNVFSFLTNNIKGDDENVFPYIADDDFVHFDISKMDQWDLLFSHAQTKGLYLHFKTQETENDQLLDGGDLKANRKIYYRMLIAHFGHHLALNWNLGEEHDLWEEKNDPENTRVKAYAQYFYDNDPYQHHVVIHSYPGQQHQLYEPLLGNASKVTGPSIQTNWSDVHKQTLEWVNKSANAGKPWVCANDEQGNYKIGVKPDKGFEGNESDNHDDIRKSVLWGNMMAGGAGVEYYFGYGFVHSDLTCQDFRSRDKMWDYTRYALKFFNEYVPFWQMKNQNSLVGNNKNENNKYCLAQEGKVYVVFFDDTDNTGTLDLSGVDANFTLKWFNPRTGKFEGDQKTVTGNQKVAIGTPPTDSDKDWVALFTETDGNVTNTPPTVSLESPSKNGKFKVGDEVKLTATASDADGTVSKVIFYEGSNILFEDDKAPYEYTWKVNKKGSYSLSAKAIDDKGDDTTSDNIPIVVEAPIPVNCDVDFEEKDGVLIIEAESGKIAGDWELKTSIGGYTGTGYYVWSGPNYGDSPGNGLISYKFRINKPGSYRFQWRSRITKGTNETEHNDSWLKFPDAQLHAKKGDAIVYPNGGFNVPEGATKVPGSKNGWFKIYMNQTNKWIWQASTWDHNGHTIHINFDKAGVYEMQISGRSNGHGVDRIVMSHSSVKASDVTKTDLQETLCEGNTPPKNEQPTINITSPKNGTAFKSDESITIEVTASDSDGTVKKVELYIDGTKKADDNESPYSFTITDLGKGEYKIYAKAIDNEEASNTSSTINITVTNSDDPIGTIPIALKIEAISDTELSISWEAVEGVEQYTLEYSFTGKEDSYQELGTVLNADLKSLNHNELSPESLIYYRLKVKMEDGSEQYSPVKIGSPKDPDIPTGIEHKRGFNKFLLYPNPNQGMFTLELTTQSIEQGQLSLLNLMGKQVYEQEVSTQGAYQIRIPKLPKGIYIAFIKTPKYYQAKRVEVN